MKRLFKAILLSLVATLVVGMPVLAVVSYRATYTIVESGGTPYDMLPTSVLSPNQWLADNGFMQDDALDTRIETLGGLVKPHMVATNKTLTSVPVPANSQTNLYFTTANSDLSSLDIITGYDGYITITDDDTPAQETLEPGSDFEIEQSGYIDTDAGADKNLVYKEDAFRTYVDGANTITSRIQDWVAAFPTVDATSQGSVVVNATNHTVTYPAGLAVDDLLVVFFTTDSNPAITPPVAVGFTTLYDEIAIAAVARTMCVYKVVDGTEGVSGVFVTGDAQMTSYVCFRISGYSGVPEKSAVVTLDNATPNSANLAPSWGNQWTLWISHFGQDGLGGNAINVWIPAYTDNRINVVPADNEGAITGISTRNLAALFDDPGQYQITAITEWAAHTVAIAPADYSVTATGISSGEYTVKTYGVANEPQWATGDVLHFTGANNSNIDAGDIGDGNKLWMSLWFNLDTAIPDGGSGTDQYLIGKYTDADEFLLVWIEGADGKIYLSHNEAGVAETIGTAETAWALGWHHILASCSTVVGQRLIADGVAAVVDAGNVTAISQTPSAFCIGARDNGVNAEGFIGEIQNVILGIGDLTVAEEAALYTGIAPTGANAPTEYWYIDEGTGTAITSYGSVATAGTADAACSWETSTYTTGKTGRLCDFYIEVDDGVTDADRWGDNLKGASVPANANDWYLNQNNVMPYMDYYKHTVGGVQHAWYQPNYMVTATDYDGTETAGGSAVTVTDNTMTDVPGYWVNALVTITAAGDAAPEGESRVCTVFAAGGVITVAPAFSANVDIGDTFTVDFGTLIDRSYYGLSFDAVDDVVTITDADELDLTDELTIEGWVQIYNTGGNNSVLGKSTTIWTQTSYTLQIANNEHPYFYTSSDGGGGGLSVLDSGFVIAEDTWYYLVATFDRPIRRIYVQSVLENSDSWDFDIFIGTSDIYIGRYTGNSDTLDGMVDEIRIYNRALEQDEITANYNAGQGSYTPYSTIGLVGWWHMEEGSGPTIADSSGEGNTGNITEAIFVNGKVPRPAGNGGTNDSRVTWGANPTGVSGALGGMVSEGQPTPGGLPEDPARDVLLETPVTDWFIEPAVGVGESLRTNPLRPFVTMWSDNSTLTELQCWRIYALALILLVTVATALAVGRHQGITAIMAGVAILGTVVLTIFPMWALVFAIGMFIGGLVMERSPSL